MSTVSRKELEAVRRLVQKGSRQRALSEYSRLVELNPQDPKLLLEFGDVYRRWDQVDEAVGRYTEVARLYQAEGFEMRAIAMLKKVVQLDSDRSSAYIALADLYQQSGFKGEAVAALRAAAEAYKRRGREKEALESLRKMAAADPSLTANRIEAAEQLARAGKATEAVSEYREAITVLESREEGEQASEIREKILAIKPEDADAAMGIARDLYGRGQAERAEPYAKRGLESEPRPESFELLCEIYTSLGDEAALAGVLRNLSDFYRERGDDVNARETLQRVPQSAGPDSSAAEDGAESAEEDLFGSLEDLADPEPSASKVAEIDPGDENVEGAGESLLELDPGPNESELPIAGESAAPAGTDPVRVDEDLEEADFYFKQGLFEEAEPIYRRVLEKVADHPVALEKMAEIAAAGQGAENSGEDVPGNDLGDSSAIALDLGGQASDEESLEIDLELGESGGSEESSFDQGTVFNVDLGAEAGIELEIGSAAEGSIASPIAEDVSDGAASDADEFERHFDLGVGYREMKLFENAIEEFGFCKDEAIWKARSLHMIGLCELDLDRRTEAIGNIEAALALSGAGSAESATFNFDLGRALVADGQNERAIAAFDQVRSVDASYPGLEDALTALGSDLDEENLDSLEDLIADISPEDLEEA